MATATNHKPLSGIDVRALANDLVSVLAAINDAENIHKDEAAEARRTAGARMITEANKVIAAVELQAGEPVDWQPLRGFLVLSGNNKESESWAQKEVGDSVIWDAIGAALDVAQDAWKVRSIARAGGIAAMKPEQIKSTDSNSGRFRTEVMRSLAVVPDMPQIKGFMDAGDDTARVLTSQKGWRDFLKFAHQRQLKAEGKARPSEILKLARDDIAGEIKKKADEAVKKIADEALAEEQKKTKASEEQDPRFKTSGCVNSLLAAIRAVSAMGIGVGSDRADLVEAKLRELGISRDGVLSDTAITLRDAKVELAAEGEKLPGADDSTGGAPPIDSDLDIESATRAALAGNAPKEEEKSAAPAKPSKLRRKAV